jgi:hypothetical protein
MPPRKRKPAGDTDCGARRRISAEDKIARVLGLLLVRDIKKKTDQVPLLRSIGFEVSEVAAMLDMTENHVKVADHLGRKRRRTG